VQYTSRMPPQLWLVEHATAIASAHLVIGGLTYGMQVITKDAGGAQLEHIRLLDMSRTWIALAAAGISSVEITRLDGTPPWLTQELIYQVGDLWIAQ